jgi:hypothetical protein
MRYGTAFLGRLVADFLGRSGSVVLSALLFVFCLLSLPVFFVGFGTTLEGGTSINAEIWVALLFLAGLFFLRRESIDATVATALAVGAVNLALIIGISLLTLTQVQGENLSRAELAVTGDPFHASLAGVLFGVALFAYFGHTAVAICGSLVLRRDASGQALIRGCAWATATTIALYSLFVLAVTGAVPADQLTDEAGTALAPLADEVGPVIDVLGSVFAILALGMGSIYLSLDLFELTRERLPSLAPRVVAMPRRRARLLFEARRQGLKLGLTYLGTGPGGYRFAVDREQGGVVDHEEAVASGRWHLFGDEDPSHELALDIIEGDERQVRVAATSGLRMSYEGEWGDDGTSLVDVLEASDEDAGLIGWLLRSGGATLDEVAAYLGSTEQQARDRLRRLVARGAVLEQEGAPVTLYVARVARRRSRSQHQLWGALRDEGDSAGTRSPHGAPVSAGASDWHRLLFGRSGRFLLSAFPVFAAFLAGEWMVVTGTVSFTGLLSFTGVITLSILVGLYPVLLLVSSRRKGMHAPGRVFGFLARPAVLVAVYAVFLVSLFLHGLFLWEGALQRAGAIAAGLVLLVLPAALRRRGSFVRRLTVEVRDDQRDGEVRFAMVSGGQPAAGHVHLQYEGSERRVDEVVGAIPHFDSLRRALFVPRAGGAESPGELKVWAHRVTPEGVSESLPARARVQVDGMAQEADVALSRGEALFPLAAAEFEVEVSLRARDDL